jgi:hypothetical protein
MDFSMKIVGFRKNRLKLKIDEIDKFLKLGIKVRKTPYLVPRDVVKFKSFEDAQTWMKTETIKTIRKLTQNLPQ